jgi:hypothetical protein
MHGRGRTAASARADEQLRQVRLRELARTDPQDECRDHDQQADRAPRGHRLRRRRATRPGGDHFIRTWSCRRVMPRILITGS